MKGGIKLAKVKTPKPKKSSKNDNLRQELSLLVNKANKRVSALRKRDMSSRALVEAMRTFKRKGDKTESKLFKSDLKTESQLLRELARVNQFLNDFTSTVSGAKRMKNRDFQNLEGAFGANWAAEYGVNYDKSRIRDDYAKKAFEIYRMLQEEFTWERISGIYKGKESLIGYGSEVLITNIYDMVVAHSRTSTILDKGRQMIMDAEARYEFMAKNQMLDYDYGTLIEDPMKSNRRNFIKSSMRR